MIGDLFQVGAAAVTGVSGLGGLLWGVKRRRRRHATTHDTPAAAPAKPIVDLIGALSARQIALAAIRPGVGPVEREQLTRLAAVLMRPELIKPEPISGTPGAGPAITLVDGGTAGAGPPHGKARAALSSAGAEDSPGAASRPAGTDLPGSFSTAGPPAGGRGRSRSKKGSGKRRQVRRK